jgi:hypothetical protein
MSHDNVSTRPAREFTLLTRLNVMACGFGPSMTEHDMFCFPLSRKPLPSTVCESLRERHLIRKQYFSTSAPSPKSSFALPQTTSTSANAGSHLQHKTVTIKSKPRFQAESTTRVCRFYVQHSPSDIHTFPCRRIPDRSGHRIPLLRTRFKFPLSHLTANEKARTIQFPS